MPVRDLILTAFIFGALPFVLQRPYVGILLWTWFGLMNPHRLTWDFAYGFPFAQFIGGVTLVALFTSKGDKRIPWMPMLVVLLVFDLWMTLTTMFAFEPSSAWEQWDKVMKIHLMIFVTTMVIKDKVRINWLVWVVVLSLGYYGVKGGIFTVVKGGQYQVLGPAGSFIEGNTALGLALTMTVPFMWYLRLVSGNKWIRRAMAVAVGLTSLAIIGTYSRGALLAILAMGTFLWLKSPKRGLLTVALIVAVPLIWNFMPEKWFDKMQTISTYEQDGSALGRLNSWGFAINLAKDNPLTGGGFETFSPAMFEIYGPIARARDAHSIYFEVLGEHGFVGLFLFLLLMLLAWRTGSWIIRNAKGYQDLIWASDLARMVHVSLVGYAVAGAFLGLAYFDLYYVLIAILIVTRHLVGQEIAQKSVEVRSADIVPPMAPSGIPPGGELPR